jgi:DNA-binding response OmpR family regulator
VLIVDDEAYIRRVVELKLKNKGYEVITATNGKDGLDKFKLYHPDVVVTDIKMPKMDGKAFLEQLNILENCKNSLIIVVSCSVSDTDLRWLENINGRYLEKPFSPSRLLEIIDETLVKIES